MSEDSKKKTQTYPKGVFFIKNLPYRVSKGCEVHQILRSLNEHGDLSIVNRDVAGDLSFTVKEYMGWLRDPFEAFLCAFYEGVPGVYMPLEISSMETAAWGMAENAFAYHKSVVGIKAGLKVSKCAYDEAINLLKNSWNNEGSLWKNIVNTYWVSSDY